MYYTKNMLANMTSKVNEIPDIDDKLFNLGHEVEETTITNLTNLVVGRIVDVKKHPDSDHLHVCSVDVGNQQLQIVCGASNVAINKLVIIALVGAKLPHIEIKPTTIRGVESQGMLCALSELGMEESYVNPEGLDHIHIIQDYEANVGDDPINLFGLNDSVYDVSLTANRGDCLSYYGIGRDLCAKFKERLQLNLYPINNYVNHVSVNQGINSSMILLNNFNNHYTPTWLKVILAKHHIATSDYISDYLNYLRLITGQTFNVYDASKLDINALSITTINQDTTIKVEDKELTLASGSEVVVSGNKIIGIPAITAVDGYGVSKESTNILIEATTLNPQTIRKINKTLRIKNENTIRSEKGIDYKALNYFSGMLIDTLQSTNTEFSLLHYVVNESQPQFMNYNPNIVKRVLGIDIPIKIQNEILTNLGFVANNGGYIVPSWRFDIEHDNDLVEEVIRVFGVEKVKTINNVETLVAPHMLDHSTEVLNNKIANLLVSSGLNEIITYSLVSDKDINEFNPHNFSAINLASPLSKEHEFYRISLIPSLLKVCQYNFDRQANSVNYFEIGNIYYNQENNICEEQLLTIALGGVKTANIDGKVESYSFNDIKNIVLTLFNNLGISASFEPIKVQGFNHYASASISVDGEKLGLIGLKHPNYYKKIKQDVYVVEINLSKLQQHINTTKTYQVISNLPLIKRQITLIAKDSDKYDDIIRVFNNINYLADFRLVSIYQGDNLAPGQMSYSFELSFKQEETLTNEEIENSVNSIVENIRLLGYIFNQG